MEWDELETTQDNLTYSVDVPETSPFYDIFYDLQPFLEQLFFPWSNMHSKEPVKIRFRLRTSKPPSKERRIEVTLKRPVVPNAIKNDETN